MKTFLIQTVDKTIIHDFSFILDKQPFVPEGYVVMAIKKIQNEIDKCKLVKNIEFEYFKNNYKEIFNKYEGKYIAISGEEVVAHGDNFGDVYNEARNKGFKRPFMNIMSSKGWENR
jgi:hypothetical protein